MRWLAFGGALVVLLSGCGDDAQPGCDPDDACVAGTGSSGGSGSGTGPGASATSAAQTSAETGEGSVGPDPDDSGGTTVTVATTSDGGGTTDGGATTDGSSGTDGGSTTGEGNVVYTAEALVGALDRIRIFKEDLDADRCTWIVLVSPSIGGAYAVTTPEGWGVEQIDISDVGATCGSRSPGMFGAEAATAATGSIELGAIGPTGVYPCDVTVNVTAEFAGVLPGIPASDVLDAVQIPVDGC